MATASGPRVDDIKRIAFVTRRFHDLQGLRTVADALPAFILGAVFHWAQSYLAVIILFGAFAAYLAVRVSWIPSRLEAYYSRLGRVDPSVRSLDPTLLFGQFHPRGRADRSAPDVSGTLLIYQGLIFASAHHDLPVFVQVGLSMFMLGFSPTWILIHDWRYRAHWLVPLGVGMALALRLGSVATAQREVAWQVFACLGCGFALAIAGALDHLLLVKSLSGGASAALRADHADVN